MKSRVDVVKDYLLKEHGVDLPKEEIMKNFCPTAHRFDIVKLNIELDRNQCITSSCEECWNEEVSYKE